jgi:thioredoxin-like negative regulator of GroEL
MEELTYEQMKDLLHKDAASFSAFVYTPLCGTCKAAERMLMVIKEMMPNLSLYKCNVNVMPQLAQHWQIQSVPCLLVFQQGELTKKAYAMKSVQDLFVLLS